MLISGHFVDKYHLFLGPVQFFRQRKIVQFTINDQPVILDFKILTISTNPLVRPVKLDANF
jgi:hypothetical protein